MCASWWDRHRNHDPPTDPSRQRHAYGGDVPAGHRLDPPGIDQPPDLLGDHLRGTTGIDLNQLDPASGDAVARVQLLDSQLTARETRRPIDPGRTLQRHHESDRQFVRRV